MGSSGEEILRSLIEIVDTNSFSLNSTTTVVKNHLLWYEFITNDSSKILNNKVMNFIGVEFGLSPLSLNIPAKIDFIRTKAHEFCPSHIFDIDFDPKLIIIDYNSSGTSKSVKNDIGKCKSFFSNSLIFIEQPFQNGIEFDRIPSVKYIFDGANYPKLIEGGQIRKGDIANIKIGRNSPDEFLGLIQNDIDVCFGNVLSGRIGDNIISSISKKYSTINFSVLERDGIPYTQESDLDETIIFEYSTSKSTIQN
ncbi:MAG: hypothetical protein LBI63_00905 [Candidatus Ancillula sp.]|jgi:hypothetical protein|nr:hypothetical protein [Candidatus Ancillula sp.]